MITGGNKHCIQLGVVEHPSEIGDSFRLGTASFHGFHGQSQAILVHVTDIVKRNPFGVQGGIRVCHSASRTNDSDGQVAVGRLLSGNRVEHPRR